MANGFTLHTSLHPDRARHLHCFELNPTECKEYDTLNHRQTFIDEVCEWLGQQPGVEFRRVDFPSNIVAAYPKIGSIGYNLYELERKQSNLDTNTNASQREKIALHLIATPSRLQECYPPKFQQDITDYFNRVKRESGACNDDQTYRVGIVEERRYSKVIHLHQDIWDSKRDIVCHRLMAQLGLGVHSIPTFEDKKGTTANRTGKMRRIYARKTFVKRISAAEAMEFLDSHHLWGATKAKHNYGLFLVKKSGDEDELVAVATFSARRKIVRAGKAHRSHELLRFCSKKDSNVVGGISKLTKAFIDEKSPDDIVTVVDRDWGDGSGWKALGFYRVATMDPIVMVVKSPMTSEESPRRRHLVGAGIKIATDDDGKTVTSMKNKDRVGLTANLLEELNSLDSVSSILVALSNHEFYPVYDTGVERLMKVVSDESLQQVDADTTEEMIVDSLWRDSKPTYAKDYYSPNFGISALLKHASTTPSFLSDEKRN